MTETPSPPSETSAAAAPRVRVHTTTYCGWCRRAEALLERHGIRYEAIDVTNDLQARAALVDQADGRRTVPVVFVDGAPIGGYQELARLILAGSLDHLMSGVPDAPLLRTRASGD